MERQAIPVKIEERNETHETEKRGIVSKSIDSGDWSETSSVNSTLGSEFTGSKDRDRTASSDDEDLDRPTPGDGRDQEGRQVPKKPTASQISAKPTARSGSKKDGRSRQGREIIRRSVPEKICAPRGIPCSWEDADEADTMLFKMRNEGHNWEIIRKMWLEMTGQDPAPSTLPNRYNRLKNNLTHLGKGDVRYQAKQSHPR